MFAEGRAQELIRDSAWVLQQKYDGQRRMACRRKGKPLGANRRGLAVPLTVGVAASLDAMNSDGSLEVDGEQMGDTLVLFDVLI